MKVNTVFIFFLKLSAIILIGINLIGLFIPLRNSDIYLEDNTFFKDDITLTEEQLLNILSLKKVSDADFAIKANNAVNEGLAHYWLDEGIDKYNLRVPVFENYILHFSSYISPSSFKKYQFINYKKAIKRGVGLCSQHSIILSEILKKNNIDSKIVGLAGHVVVMANIDKDKNLWWVLDPDYGVVIKHSIGQIERDPKIITDYYYENGYSEEETIKLINIYGSEGNFVTDGAIEYSGNKKYYFEKIAYIAIWVIPLFLFFLVSVIKKNTKL